MVLATISFQQFSEATKLVALLVGGFWAVWTFHKLQKVQAAELGNRQTRVAIRKSRIEHQELRIRLLRQQPQLAVELNISETAAAIANYKSFLCVSVTLKNEGEQNLNVIFGPNPLTVGRILFQNDGKRSLEIQKLGASLFVDKHEEPVRERMLRVGQKRQMALTIIPIAEPSAYIFQFEAIYNRRPFDDENSSERGMDVAAIEQAFYFATASPTPSSAAVAA
jgi:hypothetical protein